MDLSAHTRDALDWGTILAALSEKARTTLGQEAALAAPLCERLSVARARYAAVQELISLEELGERLPVGGVVDVRAELDRAARSTVLEPAELRDVGSCLYALDRVRRWLDERADKAPELHALSAPIQPELDLVGLLVDAFEPNGDLSGETFPEIADLRTRVGQLKATIRETLEEIVRGDSMGGALQDRYVTERGGRFVVPVRAGFKRSGMGIVHGTSQSGETVFLEPALVVERTNQLKEVEGALLREERRVLTQLSMRVAHAVPEISQALAAAVELDLVCARAGLGERLGGRIPAVGDDGVVQLQDARHPVLALRGVDVVPNDLRLDGRCPGLVLTGPNTGGKTIALKTLGLCVLMVRAGIPIPCGVDSRVDLFSPVVADIGDLQAVAEDLSTFSGHLMVLKQMLAAAGPNALVLLDEVGVGTDPAQGAALARAVLEALVDAGARVGVTTHYAEVKALGATDRRFKVCALQYVDGRPTYRLETGLAGQSHGLSVARQLGLPPAIVDRARAVMDATTRELSDLMEALEVERATLAVSRATFEEKERALLHRERTLTQKLAALDAKRADLNRDVAARFQERVREREAQIKQLIAALQKNPNLKLAGRTLAQVRELEAEVAKETKAPSAPSRGPAPTSVSPGDPVWVRTVGGKGEVLRSLSGKKVEVQVGALKMKVKLSDLEVVHRAGARPSWPPPKAPKKVSPPETVAKTERLDTQSGGGLRTSQNTCDLRGQRVDAAIDEVDRFLSGLLAGGDRVGWILHGHGTGALKVAVRRWLPTCATATRWRPANPGEGGDAYTLVELG